MTKEELDFQIAEEKSKSEEIIISLKKKYANANNPYKVGDTIQDHISKGIIERISYYFGYDVECRYFCLELKKDGTPRKYKNKRWFFQSNIKK